jgi:hypothetical protein
VAGAIPFNTVGVLDSMTHPLANAAISNFAISTFDTDYLLVKATHLAKALGILRQAGHTIELPEEKR